MGYENVCYEVNNNKIDPIFQRHVYTFEDLNPNKTI